MTIPFARLEIHSNRGASQELLLDRDLMSIGRAPDNALVLNELAVSRYHARITRETDRYLITDLGSSNGTRVNDAELSPRTPMPLADGDIIRIGTFELRFRSSASLQDQLGAIVAPPSSTTHHRVRRTQRTYAPGQHASVDPRFPTGARHTPPRP